MRSSIFLLLLNRVFGKEYFIPSNNLTNNSSNGVFITYKNDVKHETSVDDIREKFKNLRK
jgi:hypothetical protein